MKVAFNDNDIKLEILEKTIIEKSKNENRHLGVVNVNGYLITYFYKLKFSNGVYYINTELANGKNRSRILDLSYGYYNGYGDNNLDSYLSIINRNGFSYSIIKYDNNINFIYVYNDIYQQLFDINNNFNDLD